MAENILGGLYSLGNRAKRQLRDLLSNPRAYMEQAGGQLRDPLRGATARDVARRTFEPTEESMARAVDWWNPSPLGAIAGVVKPKGGNWLSGSVEDALKGLKRGDVEQAVARMTRENPGMSPRIARIIAEQSATPETAILNQWIEGPLTKYVKTRMASPDDEVRRLAEQGVLHFEPRLSRMFETTSSLNRQAAKEAAGYPAEQMATTDLARAWEAVSDGEVWTGKAGLERGQTLAQNPWLRSVSPDTPIHALSNSPHSGEYLGFPHLIDELSNALNPNSGLPRHLQLTPEAVKNMSMEKAVRLVDDINKWRAAQKVEANRKLAEQASVVREYAENNPRGLRWVELKTTKEAPSDLVLPSGYRISKHEGSLPGYQVYGPEGNLIAYGDTQEQVLRDNAEKIWGRQALADQLKYEGDVMGHCVGGYCDDVLSGRSRIFSLRDAKGEPHVTVQVGKPDVMLDINLRDLWAANQGDKLKGLSEGEIDNLFAKKFESRTDVQNIYAKYDSIDDAVERVAEKFFPREYQAAKDRIPSRIVQIKGKQNRAPNPEYLPFVQDFVRNSPLGSPWSDVGDLANTGLYDARQYSGSLGNLVDQLVERRGHPFVTPDEYNLLYERGQLPEFASGGRVRSPIAIPPGTDTMTTGIRGRSDETLPTEPASGYNSWDIFLRDD